MPAEYDALRPTNLDEYIGQAPLKREVRVAIAAARQGERAMRSLLLVGGAGCGKTSLAQVIANELEQPLVTVNCPFEVTALMRYINKPKVLFFDEIHRTRQHDQEYLLPLIEEGVLISGPRRFEARGVTFIGATTEPQKLVGPLVDRFIMRPAFDAYTDEEMGRIVQGMCVKAGVSFNEDDCVVLGQAAAGVPRIAKSLVMTAVDLKETTGHMPSVMDVLDLRRIRQDGLSVEHCRYIWLLANQEGRAGLQLIASTLDMPPSAIVQTERLLVNKGLLVITPRGRALSADGWAWINDNPED